MKKISKRALATFLTVVMLMSVVPLTAFAKGKDTTTSLGDTEYSIGATNSFGKIISDAMQEYNDAEQTPNHITNVEFSNNAVVVSFETDTYANVAVAIYNEDSGEMLASGFESVSPEEKTATVAIDKELPQYFIVKAFLLDNDMAALCKEYVYNDKTKMYEDFLDKQVDDFDSDKIINLDESEDTNFAVVSDDVTTITCSPSRNTLISADFESGVYVFDKADTSLKSLTVGSLFYYDNGNINDTIIVKIKTITVSGDRVTIIADNSSVEEAFDYIKIDNDAKTGGFEPKEDGTDDDVIYNGRYDDDGNLVSAPSTQSNSTSTIETEDENGLVSSSDKVNADTSVEINPKFSYTDSYTIKGKEIKPEKPKKIGGGFELSGSFKIEGSLNFKIEGAFKFYYSSKFKEVEFTLTPEVSFNVTVEGKGRVEKSFGSYDWMVVPGVYVGIKPTLIFEASLTLTVDAKLSFTMGVGWNSDSGLVDKSSKPKFDFSIDIDGSIFVGIDLKPHVFAFSEKFAKIELNGEIGAEVDGTMNLAQTGKSDIHDCSKCLDGEIYLKGSLGGKIVIGEKTRFEKEVSVEFLNIKIHIKDFYWSFTHNQHGWGNCPYCYSKITFIVADAQIKTAVTAGQSIGMISKLFIGSASFIPINKQDLLKLPGYSNYIIKTATVTGSSNARYYPNENDTSNYSGNSATVNDNGEASLYYNYGEHKATISAPGYKAKKIDLENSNTSKTIVVFLDKDVGGGLTGGEQTGDLISFGSYPQSKVTDSSLVSALNACSKTWVSYGYMSGEGTNWSDGSAKPSDYMKYADVWYGGAKYRAVKFSTYRPYWTNYKSTTSTDYTSQDNNGYYINNTYWFKFEPLQWRVLDPAQGLVMCETVIDSQSYNNYVLYSNNEYYGNPEKTYYANDYAKSSIHKWLNEGFYNTAFTASQQSSIKVSTLDNSSTSGYNSATTYDKVFLLSYNEMLNSKYGFSTRNSTHDTARRAKSSDYAQSQGCWKSTGSDYLNCRYWWLRTPGYFSSNACDVNNDGNVYNNGSNVNYSFIGVRPALKLNLQSGIYQSSSAESGKLHADASGADASQVSGTVTCKNAVDGNLYMIYAVSDYSADCAITVESFYYINQAVGENGTAKFDCKPKSGENLTLLVVGDFGSGVEVKTVTVDPITEPKNVNSVSLDNKTINYKSSATLTPSISADDGAEYTVSYSSSNGNVTVDNNGNIYGAKKGSATITCTVTDSNGNTVSDTCTVTVIVGNVTSVSLNGTTMNYKSTATLIPSISADDGAEYTVSYSSSNGNVTVDENGNIYGAKKGSATITCTVTDSNGNTVSDTCTVTVKYSTFQWIIKILLFGWIWY